MERTTVRVYLRGEDGEHDQFVTPINLPTQEAHDYYIGKWCNMGIETDKMMKCYMVETLKIEELK